MQASTIGLGTWAIGGGPWWGESDDKTSIRAIQESIDRGVTLIDTAPAYGFGRSEILVGKALKGRRHEVVLATKCGIWWESAEGERLCEVEGVTAFKNLSPQTIRRELELSLQRLQVDCIDLYQTHLPVFDQSSYKLDDTIACLIALRDEGKIRAIGASNVTEDELKVYLDAGALDSLQPKYSMLDRAAENSLLPFCIEHNVSTLAFSPLEQGLLTGTLGMDFKVDANSSRNGIPWFKPENRKRVLDLLAGWSPLMDKYDCTKGQLVIAWTLVQPGITFVLCGARKPEHANNNAEAGNIVLQTEDVIMMHNDLVKLGQPL